jgi:hypothetical protein
MRRAGILICSIFAALILAVASAALAAGAGGGVDPAVKKWSGWQGEVACGTLPFNPLVAFSRPTDAEKARTPAAAALRAVLAEDLYGQFGAPRHGWRLLAESSDLAEFASGRLGQRVQVIPVERHGKHWEQVGYSGGCEPALLRGGRQAITWTLAPGQKLKPSTRTIEVQLGPGECDGGRPQAGRLERPAFREEDGALLMALWLGPVRKGPSTCQGIGEPPVKITLPRRLGHRRLLDGGVFPPISSAQQIRREEEG